MIEVQHHACQALLAVLRGRSLTSTLSAIWQQDGGIDGSARGAIQDIAYGSCRWLGTLREVLAQLLRKPVTDPPL